jgi:hypothetical protein
MSERRSELKAVAAGDGGSPEQDLVAITTQIWDAMTQINNRVLALAQTSWRHAQAVAEEMRTCQSPKEMLDVQIKASRMAMDDFMDESRKLSELMIKMSAAAINLMRMPR